MLFLSSCGSPSKILTTDENQSNLDFKYTVYQPIESYVYGSVECEEKSVDKLLSLSNYELMDITIVGDYYYNNLSVDGIPFQVVIVPIKINTLFFNYIETDQMEFDLVINSELLPETDPLDVGRRFLALVFVTNPTEEFNYNGICDPETLFYITEENRIIPLITSDLFKSYTDMKIEEFSDVLTRVRKESLNQGVENTLPNISIGNFIKPDGSFENWDIPWLSKEEEYEVKIGLPTFETEIWFDDSYRVLMAPEFFEDGLVSIVFYIPSSLNSDMDIEKVTAYYRSLILGIRRLNMLANNIIDNNVDVGFLQNHLSLK